MIRALNIHHRQQRYSIDWIYSDFLQCFTGVVGVEYFYDFCIRAEYTFNGNTGLGGFKALNG
jgi:hypothetical protein